MRSNKKKFNWGLTWKCVNPILFYLYFSFVSHDFQQLNTLFLVLFRNGVRNFIDIHIVGDIFLLHMATTLIFWKINKYIHIDVSLLSTILRHALLSAILKWQKVLTERLERTIIFIIIVREKKTANNMLPKQQIVKTYKPPLQAY